MSGGDPISKPYLLSDMYGKPAVASIDKDMSSGPTVALTAVPVSDVNAGQEETTVAYDVDEAPGAQSTRSCRP